MTEASHQHLRILELLPWYINGTLGEAEHGEVKQHLSHCLSCNAALREDLSLNTAVQQQDSERSEARQGFAALLQRIDAPTRRQRRRSPIAPLLSYGLAAAAGGLVAWGLISMLAESPDANRDAAYTTLSSTSPTGRDRVDVVFEGAPDETFVGAFVAGLDATVVAGPSQIGRYTIEPRSAEEVDQLIETLRRDPRVRFAGRNFTDDGASVSVTP